MRAVPSRHLQHRGRKRLHGSRHVMPRWHVCTGAFLVRPLSPGFFSCHARGAVPLGVHAVSCWFVGHFMGCHVFGSLWLVSTGLLQHHAQRHQPCHLLGLSCGYLFRYTWCAKPILLPKLRPGADLPSRLYYPNACHVRRRRHAALLFPRGAQQCVCYPSRGLFFYSEHNPVVDVRRPRLLVRRHVCRVRRR